MPSDNLNMDEITEERRKALAASIRTITNEELKAAGDALFPTFDHPWRETFFNFITENSGATFHYAITQDKINIIYCSAKDKGMWFIANGMGPLQAKGREIMKKLASEAR